MLSHEIACSAYVQVLKMSRPKRPILEIVTTATRQVVKKFKTATGNLSAPPLGLTEVARQWVATNYKVRSLSPPTAVRPP